MQAGDDALITQIQALVSRHQAKTDELEDRHLDSCIDEAQEMSQRHTLSPFLPTTPTDLAHFFTALNIGPKHLLIDLGCGDGRPLVAAALTRDCCGVGVDISQECVGLATSIAREEGIGQDVVEFLRVDLLEEEADVVGQLVEAAARREAAKTEPPAVVDSVVIFLYVYPTLLTKLTGVVGKLTSSFLEKERIKLVQVVTLTYHFDADALKDGAWPPSSSLHILCEGRFEIHTCT